MTHTKSPEPDFRDAQHELARHELRYAERKMVQAGEPVAAGRSVLARQELWLTGFAGWIVAELALVLLARDSSFVAAVSDGSPGGWCRLGFMLIGVAWGIAHWRRTKRCRAAVELAEARDDAS